MDDMKRVTSLEEFQSYYAQTEHLRALKAHLVETFTTGWRSKKTLPGYSVTAGEFVDFGINPGLRLPDGGYNLRETVNCPATGFNMRMRAAIHAITRFEEQTEGAVYICEQKTPMYTFFADYFEDIIGSEYLGDAVPLGGTDAEGLRNEDATNLTFEDRSFDIAISFEVLEHIPDYLTALKETHRTLRPGGRFYFTAPFNPHVADHLIRAKIENGEVVHILPPEMHGDPVTGEGILCFQHFGWTIADELRTAGFNTVEAFVFDQPEFGYYTQDPIIVFRALA